MYFFIFWGVSIALFGLSTIAHSTSSPVFFFMMSQIRFRNEDGLSPAFAALSGVAEFKAIGTTNTIFSARACRAKAAKIAPDNIIMTRNDFTFIFIAHRLLSEVVGKPLDSISILFQFVR